MAWIPEIMREGDFWVNIIGWFIHTQSRIYDAGQLTQTVTDRHLYVLVSQAYKLIIE